jgi:hypothetical protein
MMTTLGTHRPTTWHHPEWQAHGAAPMNMLHPDAAGLGLWTNLDRIALQGPATPSLYPASEGISPILPVSPLQQSLDLSDPQMLDLGDIEPWYQFGDDLSYGAHNTQEPQKINQNPATRDMWTNSLQPLPTCPPQAWPEMSSTDTSSLITPHPTSSYFLPIQHPEPVLIEQPEALIQADVEPSIPTREETGGGELVAMGLYDSPEQSKMPSQSLLASSLSLATPMNATSTSVGKGLKLEETWSPDTEDMPSGDLEDGEGEIVDFEADQLGQMAPLGVPAATFDPTNSDMANRSFFLDDNTTFDLPQQQQHQQQHYEQQQQNQSLADPRTLYAFGSSVDMGGAGQMGWI